MNTEPTPLEIVPAPEADPWPQRKRDVRTCEWRVYEKLLNKLELAIDRLMGDGKENMSPADIARLLELAAKLGRLAAGLPSDHTAHWLGHLRRRFVRAESEGFRVLPIGTRKTPRLRKQPRAVAQRHKTQGLPEIESRPNRSNDFAE